MNRKKSPQLVLDLTEEFMSQGWNKAQAKSMAWAEYFEIKMGQWASQMTGEAFFGPEVRIDCYCSDCKDGGHLLPDTVRMWLTMHKDHNTKTFARK